MRRGKTEKLGDILRNVLARRAIAGAYQIRQLHDSLAQILDRQHTEHIRVGGLKKGRLVIITDSPARAYELKAFHGERILEGLAAAGHRGIRRVTFECETAGHD